MWGTNGDKDYFVEVYLYRFILVLSAFQVIKAVFLLLVWERGKGKLLQKEFYTLPFGQMGEDRELLTVSTVPY